MEHVCDMIRRQARDHILATAFLWDLREDQEITNLIESMSRMVEAAV